MDILEIIKRRKSIYPNAYLKKEISTEVLHYILEAATWAPTHRMTEPWRFYVLQSETSKKGLADFLGNQYLANNPERDSSDIKFKKLSSKPLQSNVVVAICMHRADDSPVSEWEEIAAVSMAVQNMWLACDKFGIGAYWSSIKYVLGRPPLLNLPSDVTCLGLFYMGYAEETSADRKRRPVSEVAEFL